jgi:hypothetical protein
MSHASGSHLQEFMNQMNGKISDSDFSTGTFGNGNEKNSAIDLNGHSSGDRAGKQFDKFPARAIITIGLIGAMQRSKLLTSSDKCDRRQHAGTIRFFRK